MRPSRQPHDQPIGLGLVDIAFGLLLPDDIIAYRFDEEIGPFRSRRGRGVVEREQRLDLVRTDRSIWPDQPAQCQDILGSNLVRGGEPGGQVRKRGHAGIPHRSFTAR